jgi:hypothetical protein
MRRCASATAQRAVTLLLGLVAPAAARAEDTPSERGPIQVEEHLGWQDPVGSFGLAVVYDGAGRFSAGAGVGLTKLRKEELPAFGVLGRMRLLRFPWGSLGVGLTLSRENLSHEQFVGSEWSTWSFAPAYRATGTAGIELTNHAWSLRFDAGLGYILNHGRCSGGYVDGDAAGACDVPRLLPSFAAKVGYRFATPSWPAAAPDSPPSGYKDPSTALHLSLWSTLVPILAATAVLVPSLSSDIGPALTVAGIATLAAGLSFGPSLGHAYAGAPLRAWGGGALRLLAIAAGVSAYIEARRGTHELGPDPGGEGFAAFLISAAIVSGVYDISAAPGAARRANDRNSLSSVAVAPTALRSSNGVTPALSLLGRF